MGDFHSSDQYNQNGGHVINIFLSGMDIFVFGDSFALGVGDSRHHGWLGRMQRLWYDCNPDLTVYNLGIRGDTTALVARRWAQEFKARHRAGEITRLIFSFGVNDACLDQETGEPRSDPVASGHALEAILTEAQGLAPTLVIGPLPIAEAAVNARSAAIDEAFRNVTEKDNVPYLAPLASLSKSADWMHSVTEIDGAHPTAIGYEVLTKYLWHVFDWRGWFEKNG